jgi:hypothetical protein
MGYDLDDDRLLLHTIQSAGAFEVLRSRGTLRPDPSMADPLFADAYDFMFRQMAARLPTSGNGALWLWARTTRRDLVSCCRRSPGQVLLTCRVPRERALLSHEVEWHHVLNRGLGEMPPLAGETAGDAYARWEKASDALGSRLEAAGIERTTTPVRDWPADLRNEIERSWERIFDRGSYGPHEFWQATVHALHAGDVTEAVRITG